MTKTNRPLNHYNSLSIRIPAPSGSAYVHVIENHDGSIYKIFFTIGKAGSQINAWCDGLSRMVAELLQTRDITSVINELSQITSSKHNIQLNGVTARSDIEAFVLALVKYRNSKAPEELYRPPKFTKAY